MDSSKTIKTVSIYSETGEVDFSLDKIIIEYTDTTPDEIKGLKECFEFLAQTVKDNEVKDYKELMAKYPKIYQVFTTKKEDKSSEEKKDESSSGKTDKNEGKKKKKKATNIVIYSVAGLLLVGGVYHGVAALVRGKPKSNGQNQSKKTIEEKPNALPTIDPNRSDYLNKIGSYVVNDDLYDEVQNYINGSVRNEEALLRILEKINNRLETNMVELQDFLTGKASTMRGSYYNVSLHNMYDEGTDNYLVLKFFDDLLGDSNSVGNNVMTYAFTGDRDKALKASSKLMNAIVDFVYNGAPFTTPDGRNIYLHDGDGLDGFVEDSIMVLGCEMLKEDWGYTAVINGKVYNQAQLREMFNDKYVSYTKVLQNNIGYGKK